MRNNETGEFEMVVGNRQLLGGFFLIVLLFAVAFVLGYVVGQNSRPPGTHAEARPATSVPGQTAQDNRPQPSTVAAPTPQEPAPREAPPAQEESGSQPTTHPARDGAAAPAPAPAASSGEAPAGSYWQVIATANHESAQTIVQSLRDKGFPASMSPGPSNLTRVLVGPYSDSASMGRAKTELESAGFNRLVTFKR